MQQLNVKLYIIPAVFFIILIIIVLIVPFRKQKTSIEPTNIPTPTSIGTRQVPTNNNQQPTTNNRRPTTIVSPTPITPTFTGAKLDEELPADVKELTEQKISLRDKTPLQEAGFSIDFDYANDKFVITLDDPKDQNKTAFIKWRTANYPAIPENRFIIR